MAGGFRITPRDPQAQQAQSLCVADSMYIVTDLAPDSGKLRWSDGEDPHS